MLYKLLVCLARRLLWLSCASSAFLRSGQSAGPGTALLCEVSSLVAIVVLCVMRPYSLVAVYPTFRRNVVIGNVITHFFVLLPYSEPTFHSFLSASCELPLIFFRLPTSLFLSISRMSLPYSTYVASSVRIPAECYPSLPVRAVRASCRNKCFR